MKSKMKIIGIPIVITLVWAAVVFYFTLPAINIHSPGFWGYVISILIIYGISNFVSCGISSIFGRERKTMFYRGIGNYKSVTIPFLLGGGLFVLMLLILLIGSPVFHAKRYADILKVEELDFAEDLSESLSTSSIALMDTDSARMLGDREIGSLSELVSQFNVSQNYTQIDYAGNPKKVSALDYEGFFKWLNNRDKGIPGYVSVDPVTMDADYTELEKGMIYVPSAFFGEDLMRHIRFSYPTAILDHLHFEVDEEGNPYYIVSVREYTIGLFGGETIGGIIIINPVTGEMEKCDVEDIPVWVDKVFDGDLLCEQYKWHGELANGYFNTLFAKKGCKTITRNSAMSQEDGDEENNVYVDYGYIAKDGDIWVYTGVTSLNSDASNIGFVLMNQRTGKAHYYNVSGADETSAMKAAEGEVQEKGYVASFPSLINVEGTPTYIMVLKDASGLVKLFAAVDVEQYNIVATGSTQAECFEKYRKLLGLESSEESGDGEEGTQNQEQPETTTIEIVIRKLMYADVNGNTYAYLGTEDEKIYKVKFDGNEKLMYVKEGDTLIAECVGHEIESFTIKAAQPQTAQ